MFLRSLVFVLLVAPLALRAEELTPEQEKEAKAAAAEDELEKKGSELEQIAAMKTLNGVFSLGDQGTGNSAVAGLLTISAEKSYLVKLADPGLYKRLIAYNRKKVTLGGKLRNQEKYLIVSEILESTGAPSPDRKKRGGI